ncbi:pimeloyl-CoA dehydrogenase small subunit [Alcanivorax sp. N3-2A]|nr:pimeloyl-CoA dehydrogenase small subunit [Alcanivorax sp. N3-2A]|tara:strand:- start:62 stop:1180 length:1119 start_codon:yes stop_codon:yes gene_type:complete
MSTLNAEARALLDHSVERYLRQHYDFPARRRIAAGAAGYSPDHWQRFAELGWLGIPFTEADGGLGGTPADTLGLMRAFGEALVVEPYLAVVGLAGQALARVADTATASGLLAALVAGQARPALAWEEAGSRGNPALVSVRAHHQGGQWRLNGDKIGVPHGAQATHLLVSARHAGEAAETHGVDLFLLDPAAGGVTLTGYPTVDGHRAANLTLDDAPARPLTDDAQAVALLRQVLDQAILMATAEATGIMQTLLDKTLDYTRTRHQFGVPIASFQVLQHRLADMYIACTGTAHLLEHTLTGWRPHGDNQTAAALLKVRLNQAGRYLGQQAIQLHGGIGMTDELDVGHYFKRLTALGVQFGGDDYFLRRIWAGG